MDILANSVVFGGRPSKSEVYGFSCFGDHEGIVSLRNSSDKEQKYTLKLDELIGVRKSFAFGEMHTVLPYSITGAKGAYSYGDTVEFTLKPYQTKIVHFGKKNKELEITYCKAISDKELLITFNQFVNIDNALSKENTVVRKELLEDYILTMKVLMHLKKELLNRLLMWPVFLVFRDIQSDFQTFTSDPDFLLEALQHSA